MVTFGWRSRLSLAAGMLGGTLGFVGTMSGSVRSHFANPEVAQAAAAAVAVAVVANAVARRPATHWILIRVIAVGFPWFAVPPVAAVVIGPLGSAQVSALFAAWALAVAALMLLCARLAQEPQPPPS